MKSLQILPAAFLFVTGFTRVHAQETAVRGVQGVPYYPAEKSIDDPQKRCFIDMKLPEEKPGFATLVWFHGGGLTGGMMRGRAKVYASNRRIDPFEIYENDPTVVPENELVTMLHFPVK